MKKLIINMNYFDVKVYYFTQASGSQIINNFSYYRNMLWQGDAVQIGEDSPWHIYSVHDFTNRDIKMATHCDNSLQRSLLTVAQAYPSSTFNFYLVKNGS